MYTYRVLRVNRVIDGDTVDVTLDLGFNLSLKQRLRVIGIDAPETRTTDLDEKSKGLTAKAFAESWLAASDKLLVTTYKDDKYGRMLGDFRREQESQSFSEAILSVGMAKPYTP